MSTSKLSVAAAVAAAPCRVPRNHSCEATTNADSTDASRFYRHDQAHKRPHHVHTVDPDGSSVEQRDQSDLWVSGRGSIDLDLPQTVAWLREVVEVPQIPATFQIPRPNAHRRSLTYKSLMGTVPTRPTLRCMDDAAREAAVQNLLRDSDVVPESVEIVRAGRVGDRVTVLARWAVAGRRRMERQRQSRFRSQGLGSLGQHCTGSVGLGC